MLPSRPLPTLGANGFPSPDCAKGNVPNSMSDRVRDVDAVLDALPGWFGKAVAADQAGVMGHSRGTVTALAVAGGSTVWGTLPDSRVKAIMGMAIGAVAINNDVNLAAITHADPAPEGRVRPQHVAGQHRRGVRPDPGGTDKQNVLIEDGTHRSFDSTYCAQLQSAGALFDTDGDHVVSAAEAAATNRPLDKWNVPLIAASYPGYLSGKAVHYCSPQTFTTPVNIQRLVAATNNAEYTCTDAGCGWAPHTVALPANQVGVCTVPLAAPPCTGLSTDQLKPDIVDYAVDFFGPRLDVRAPELTVPANLTVNATSPAGATVNFTATATDNTDDSPTVTCTPASGSVFAIATHAGAVHGHRRPRERGGEDVHRHRARRRTAAREPRHGGRRREPGTARAPLRSRSAPAAAPHRRVRLAAHVRDTRAPARSDARRGVDRRRQPDPGGARLLNLSRGRGGAGPGARRCR